MYHYVLLYFYLNFNLPFAVLIIISTLIQLFDHLFATSLHIRAPICFLIQDFNLLGFNNFVFLHIHLNLKLALNQLTHSVCLFRPQMNPFDSKPSTYSSSSAKPPSPETAASNTPADENQEVEQPGTPVPSEDPEVSDNGMDLSNSPI